METYTGYGAEISIDGDVLILAKKGLLAKAAGEGGPRRISLGAIAAVHFKDAGRLVNGSLQLVLGAEPAGPPGPGDPNTIMFRHKDRQAFAALRDHLLGVVAANQQRALDPATQAYDPAVPNRIQQAAIDAEADLKAAREASDKAAADLRASVGELKGAWQEAMAEAKVNVHRREADKFLAEAAELGITRQDILDAGEAMYSRVGIGRELANLERYLQAQERVRRIAGGSYQGHLGIIVLTDARLLFVFHGVVNRAFEDFPLTTINSVSTRSGLVVGELKVFASGNDAEIESINNDDLTEFAAALREEIARLKAPQPAAPAPQPAAPDVLDQLTRLAQLRDAGVVTAEEFEAAKADLLRRL